MRCCLDQIRHLNVLNLIYLDKGSEVILDYDWVVSRASRGQSVTRDSVTERDTDSLPRY